MENIIDEVKLINEKCKCKWNEDRVCLCWELLSFSLSSLYFFFVFPFCFQSFQINSFGFHFICFHFPAFFHSRSLCFLCFLSCYFCFHFLSAFFSTFTLSFWKMVPPMRRSPLSSGCCSVLGCCYVWETYTWPRFWWKIPWWGLSWASLRGSHKRWKFAVPVGYSVGPLAPLCPPRFCSGCVYSGCRRGAGPGWALGAELVSVSSICFRWHILIHHILAQACFVRKWQSPLPKPGWFGLLLVIWRFVPREPCSFGRAAQCWPTTAPAVPVAPGCWLVEFPSVLRSWFHLVVGLCRVHL